MIFRYLRKVIIKDMDSGEEKEVVEYTTSMNHIKDGMVFIARTGTGKLLVGMNLDPRLEIYDLSGKRINSIALDIDPLKVTRSERTTRCPILSARTVCSIKAKPLWGRSSLIIPTSVWTAREISWSS